MALFAVVLEEVAELGEELCRQSKPVSEGLKYATSSLLRCSRPIVYV
jgi:hypothetical protein